MENFCSFEGKIRAKHSQLSPIQTFQSHQWAIVEPLVWTWLSRTILVLVWCWSILAHLAVTNFI